ncbi:MAG TPA: competence/damage-inducible protein A [Firmicutes bacterium]|nr:competence/damage-inducible protein A [Bacillota bacterium]
MKAEIITVGTELLLGHVVDTNSAYIATRLADIGVDVFHKSSVGDNARRIEAELSDALRRSDLVIITGGLGPTDDDLTKDVVASVLGEDMVLDEGSLERIKAFFAERGREMVESNIRQALLPRSARPIPNHRGTAPGVLVEKNGKTIICLPGVPREMKAMMEDAVIPYLMQKMGDRRSVIKSRILKVSGMGESAVEDMVKDILRTQTNPTIAPLAYTGEVLLRITAKASSEDEAAGLIGRVERELRERLGDLVYGADDDRLETAVARLLLEKRVRLAVAESCTGGLLSSWLTSIPGISESFLLGVVSYSNMSKARLLGVEEDVLKRFGAVSRETALAMARGARRVGEADVGLSITGIAGPGGGSASKPVGLVYMALVSGSSAWSCRSIFPGERDEVRERAAKQALNMLRLYLLWH